MNKVKLETHQIEIRRRGHPNDEPEDLWNINGNGLTINGLLHSYISWLDVHEYADENTKRVFAFHGDQAEMIPDRHFQCGRFEYGEFGVANSIKNVRTRIEAHPKTKEEAEVYPLYFLIYAPEGENRAILVLQRYGNIGMLTQFKFTFSRFVSENYDLAIKIEPLTPIDVIRGYIDHGTVEEIVLKRADIPDDESERLMAGGLVHKPRGITVKITGKGIVDRATMHRWLENERAVYVVQQLAEVGLDGDHKTTVRINVDGTMREVDFADTGKLRPYIDIHDESLLDAETGHPIFEEINRIAKSYAHSLLKPHVE